MRFKKHIKFETKKRSIVFCFVEVRKRGDFVSRVFGPAIGIDEDPVTGSAHCFLANYWSHKLEKKIVRAYQASKRGGEMECEVTDKERVLLRGDCVIMSELIQDWDKLFS